MPNVSDVPDVGVTINGSDLPSDAYDDLLEVTVEQDVLSPSMFTLRLATIDEDTLQFSWSDSDLFAVGGEVAISMGYVDRLTTVLTGEITGLELDLASGEMPTLLVRGYDRRHRLARGTNTRSFVNTTDSDIAAQIARAQGLTPSTVATNVQLDYVLQHAESDLEFLNRRASAIGYEVVVDAKTLYFQPHQNQAQPSVTLSTDTDILEFHARLTTWGQVGEVDVRGWDPKTKQAIVSTASAQQVGSMGSSSGPGAADQAFGTATYVEVSRAVSTPDEAAQIALGQLRNLALGYLRGEGTCLGRADLKAGIVVEMQGAGERFSGPYYVVSTVHSYDPRKGYRTTFNVRRNAT